MVRRMRIRNLSLVAAGLLAAGCAGRAAPPAQPISLEGEPHVAVRVEAGAVWVSARTWTDARPVWAIPARGPVDQLAVRALPDGGFEVSFRQGNELYSGELAPDRSRRGPLRSVARPEEGAAAIATRPTASRGERGSR